MAEPKEPGETPGVRYPFINLDKSLQRAKELFDADARGREMAIPAAFAVWKYSDKSSGGFQTISALKMYGLIKDSGVGSSRKIALTEAALRFFRDEREDERQKIAREFALKPRLIAALWEDWGVNPPADTIARSHLKADRSFNDQASRSILAIYKENIAFTNLTGDDKVIGRENGEDSANTDDSHIPPSPAHKDVSGGGTGKPSNFARVDIMDGERIVFTEETQPREYLRLIASGEINEFLLDALDDFIKRQKKRLGISPSSAQSGGA